MKKKLNRKGFTLVELIVVIAILAILAGVAIPVYSGYISKAKEAADMQQLDSVKTACVFAVVSKNPEAKLNKITYTGSNASVTVDVTVPTGAAAINSVNITPYTDGATYTWQGSTTTWYWSNEGGWSDTAPAAAP